MTILEIILVSVAVEAATEIITSSDITSPFRSYIKNLVFGDEPTISYKQYFLSFVDKVLSCGYCASVWVSAFFAFMAPINVTFNVFFNFILTTLVVHRLSNWVHVVYQIIKKGRVKTYDILYKKNDELD